MNLEKCRSAGVQFDSDGVDLAISSANDEIVYRICREIEWDGKFWVKG